jgi:hypothetical protein
VTPDEVGPSEYTIEQSLAPVHLVTSGALLLATFMALAKCGNLVYPQ